MDLVKLQLQLLFFKVGNKGVTPGVVNPHFSISARLDYFRLRRR
jgi:hypothetical protein